MLCVTDIFSKYARIVSLKDKKSIAIFGAFLEYLDESGRKLNKKYGLIKAASFLKKSFKSWQQTKNVERYSVHIGGKIVVDKRFRLES